MEQFDFLEQGESDGERHWYHYCCIQSVTMMITTFLIIPNIKVILVGQLC
jgi:hypothetical protein